MTKLSENEFVLALTALDLCGGHGGRAVAMLRVECGWQLDLASYAVEFVRGWWEHKGATLP